MLTKHQEGSAAAHDEEIESKLPQAWLPLLETTAGDAQGLEDTESMINVSFRCVVGGAIGQVHDPPIARIVRGA